MIKKILISQPAPANPKSPYFEIASRHNVEFVFHQFIKVVPISTREFRDQHVNILDYTAIVFNSRHAIDNFFHLCEELRVRLPEDMKYYGISEKVILYIQKYVQYRKRKIFYSETGKLEDLAQVMAKHKTEKFLFPMSDVHTDEVTKLLDSKGLKHKECVMYRTVANEFSNGTSLNDFDMITLFTPAGVQSLVKNFPDWKQGDTRLACFGDNTAKAIEEAGLRLDLKAPTPKSPSITGSIDDYLKEQNAE